MAKQRGEQLACPTPSLKLCLSYSFLWDCTKPRMYDSSKSGSRHQLVECVMKVCPGIRNGVEHSNDTVECHLVSCMQSEGGLVKNVT
jgi:hypothetical protein